MNLDAWADQVCRIRNLLQSSGASSGPQEIQLVELTRAVASNSQGKVKWMWTAKAEHLSAKGDTAHEAVTGLLKLYRERLKQALERMQKLQSLDVSAEALLAEDDGDLT